MEFLKETVTDADGNIYHTVKIGNQVWATENLRTTSYNDGTGIPLVKVKEAWNCLMTPAYCYYDNDKNNMNKYGALYNWYAVNTGKLAPKGWHVPSDWEWDIFEKYLISNGYNWDRTTVDNKIAKSLAAKTDWYPVYPATVSGVIGNYLNENNRSGFSALPGGFRHFRGDFCNIVCHSSWWSATWCDESNAYSRHLSYNNYYLIKNESDKSCGLYVRLLRDR